MEVPILQSARGLLAGTIFGKYRERNEAQGFYEEVGAIYTVQGFEYGYVGVLQGPDLKLLNGQLEVNAEGCVDASLMKYMKSQSLGGINAASVIDQAIRNIYYILMTRAKYGVYLYAVDPSLQKWLKSLVFLFS
nr:DNA/RNA helicase domain-containing protein [Halomonas sp. UBA3074]